MQKNNLNNELVLSTVFQPFGVDDEFGLRGTLTEFFYTNVSGHQKIYSIRGHNPILGLKFIKQNLRINTTLLIYPTIEDLKNEIEKRNPKYFGVSVNVPTIQKGIEMCRIVKSLNKDIKTIIGGVGVAVFGYEGYSKPDFIDHICEGEGIEFLRSIIDGENPGDKIEHPFVVNDRSSIIGVPMSPTCYLAFNLGCEEGCEFCSTSHFFKNKTVPLIKSGKEFAKVILEAKDKLKNKYNIKKNYSFSILCEDLLRNKSFFYDLSSEIKKVNEKNGDDFSFSCFGSTDSILQLSKEKNPYEILAETGITSVWIGVESILQNRRKNHNKETIREVFAELKRHGIQTVASIVLGFDYHTQENIYEDINFVLDLSPSFCQFAILTPYPPTPTFTKYAKKFHQPIEWKNWNGFNLVFEHPNFTPQELEKVRQDALKMEIDELGPSFLRIIDTAYRGYVTQNKSKSTIMRDRAKYYKKLLPKAIPVLQYMKKDFGANDIVREKIDSLMLNIKSQVMHPGNRAIGSLLNRFYLRKIDKTVKNFKNRMTDPDLITQPNFEIE